MFLEKVIKKWASGSMLSIADQGLLSLGNFAINIHLSRILNPKEYGIFAIVFSVYLLILSFNQALILEPLSIVGMTKYKNKLTAYFKKVIVIQFLISTALSLLLLLTVFFFSYTGHSSYLPFIALVIVGPFICTFFLIRRFCYMLFKPGIAFIGTIAYSVVLSLVYYLMLKNSLVSIFNVFLLFGFASLLSALILAVVLNQMFPSLPKSVVSSKVILYRHWELGKWLLGSSLIGWLSSSIYYPLVASLSGLEATAAFKAIDNLLLPMQQVITALSLLIIPKVASQVNKDSAYLKSVSVKLTLWFTSFVLVYLSVIFMFKGYLIQFLYGANSTYIHYLWLLPFVGLSLVARAVADLGIGVSLRIAERFDVLFKSSVANSVFTLTIGFFLVWKYGILGAGIAIAVGAAIQMVISSYYFQKIFVVNKV